MHKLVLEDNQNPEVFKRRLENIKINSARDLPWFEPKAVHSNKLAVACSGPSLKDSLPQLRRRMEKAELWQPRLWFQHRVFEI